MHRESSDENDAKGATDGLTSNTSEIHPSSPPSTTNSSLKDTEKSVSMADLTLDKKSSNQSVGASASAVESSSISDEKSMSTTCPVCNEEYSEPKILPCAHRFCRKCLITWFGSAGGNPSCPICKREIGKDGKRLVVQKEEKRDRSTLNSLTGKQPLTSAKPSNTFPQGNTPTSGKDQGTARSTVSESSQPHSVLSDISQNISTLSNKYMPFPCSMAKGSTDGSVLSTTVNPKDQKTEKLMPSTKAESTKHPQSGDQTQPPDTRYFTTATDIHLSQEMPREKTRRVCEELVDKLPTDTVLAALVASAKRLQPLTCAACVPRGPATQMTCVCTAVTCCVKPAPSSTPVWPSHVGTRY